MLQLKIKFRNLFNAKNLSRGILLLLFLSAFGYSEAAPLVVTPDSVEKTIKKPGNEPFSFSGLAFYDGKLFGSSGYGLVEFENSSAKQVYQWNKLDTDVEGPWLDSANKLLWVWIPGGDEVANYDGYKWKTMRMPEPQNGLSRGNVLEGFRGISDSQKFWLEGAWHSWEWDEKHFSWNEESNPPVFTEHKSIILRRLLPTDEHLYFIMFRDNELMYSDIELQQKQIGDAVYSFEGKWNEITNKSHFVFFAEQTVSTGKTGYIRTSRGDLLEVTEAGIEKLQTPGKCEAITATSSGSLLACFHNLGVYELKSDWKLLFKTPYPLTDGEHWIHLAESDGQIALSVSPIPQLVAEKNSSDYKTVYNSSAALWIFHGQKLEKILFPKN